MPIPDTLQLLSRFRNDMIPVNFDCEVVINLGQYMNFAVVMKIQGAVQNTETVPPSRPVHRDASTVLMQSSRLCHALPQKWQVLLPNRKLHLKNDIIDFLDKKRLGLSASHAQQCGKSFVNMLAEVMWNIDGNHQTLHDRGHGIPALFGPFKGYNLPEEEKDRSRQAELLSHYSFLLEIRT